MRTRMCFDDVAWEQSEAIQDAWVHELFREETLMAIGRFILKHRRGVPIELCDPKAGAFNVSFRMKFEDGGSAIIRFPKPGATMFPEEKVRNEVDIIRYIHQHTTIPVPFILHWGTKDENPLGLGPFIIMEYIDHVMDLSDVLNTPGFAIKDRPILDPNIDIAKLELLYGQFADILLQLSTLQLPMIGSLAQIDDFTWEVAQRPLSYSANELHHPTLIHWQIFTSSTHQQNDAVDSADDCRRRYIARLLFCKLAKEGRFTTSSTNLGPFNVWCDDLRPSNVLINENLQIVGVVDWEFTYAAPMEFSHAPPWWLLLEQPEYWPDGLEAWTNIFESRLQTFLKVLREREEMAIERGRLKDGQRLSGPMQRSWESGDFWVTYAARKSFAFDAVFWKKLDARFFGPRSSTEDERWKERLELLTEDEKANMEKIVEKKLDKTRIGVLAWEPDE
ncbi:Aminoglycoside phosphotransferase [Penicillium italicum]|uniref:Aminoglycoside phosphotransferase n=1 Tax=Penicillium italicum TaxID=40296 RepID=A0A0A2LCA0_PENIT|nr:Aminoglycoside phosphotransferase [Penicillium italicum]